MIIGRFCLLFATAILVFAPETSRGITLGQVDTFEDGTFHADILPDRLLSPPTSLFPTDN